MLRIPLSTARIAAAVQSRVRLENINRLLSRSPFLFPHLLTDADFLFTAFRTSSLARQCKAVQVSFVKLHLAPLTRLDVMSHSHKHPRQY